MRRFVVDASVAMSWLFKDEATPATQRLLIDLKNDSGAVPAWWSVELANVLELAERKGRVGPAQIDDFIAVLDSLQLEVEIEAPQAGVQPLAAACRAHALTSCDACILIWRCGANCRWRRSMPPYARRRESWA
jgi:predicted nucleic acid-binding protein